MSSKSLANQKANPVRITPESFEELGHLCAVFCTAVGVYYKAHPELSEKAKQIIPADEYKRIETTAKEMVNETRASIASAFSALGTGDVPDRVLFEMTTLQLGATEYTISNMRKFMSDEELANHLPSEMKTEEAVAGFEAIQMPNVVALCEYGMNIV